MSYFETITMDDVRRKNQRYYAEDPMWRLSEDRPYNEDAMKKFIEEIRPAYKYVDEYCTGNWKKLQITVGSSKYGTCFIYYDETQKLWRTKQSISEFYGGSVVD